MNGSSRPIRDTGGNLGNLFALHDEQRVFRKLCYKIEQYGLGIKFRFWKDLVEIALGHLSKASAGQPFKYAIAAMNSMKAS